MGPILKLLTILLSASLAFAGVACSSGPPDEFCEAYAAFSAVSDDFQDTTTAAPGADKYAELDASFTEAVALLQKMEDTVDDDAVKQDIIRLKEGFQEFVETHDQEVLSADVEQSAEALDTYASDCEGVDASTEEDTDADAADEEAPAEGGLTPEIETTLKNAATAQESYITSGAGEGYASEVSLLEENGLQLPEGITLEIEPAGDGYCMTAEDADGNVGHISSGDLTIEEGPC